MPPKARSLGEIFKIDQMKVIWKKEKAEGRCDGMMHYIWKPALDNIDLDGRCDCKKKDGKLTDKNVSK